MALLSDFRRVGASNPCPVCEHRDWCLVARDHPPSAAICQRVESPRRWGDAGWLHSLCNNTAWRSPRARTISLPSPAAVQDFGELAREYVNRVNERALADLADRLGLTVTSLRRLGIGWTGRAWSFPMTDPRRDGRVCGIRLRARDGSKYAVRGSKDGIFLPAGLADGVLFVAEGPTDTAALLDLGFDAIGRPSCHGGTRHVIHHVKSKKVPRVVIMADGDGPGQQGASMLAVLLSVYCGDVRIVTPPAKDARAWVQAGATDQDVVDAVALAAAVRIPMRVTRGKP